MDKKDITPPYFVSMSHTIDENKLEKLILSLVEQMKEEIDFQSEEDQITNQTEPQQQQSELIQQNNEHTSSTLIGNINLITTSNTTTTNGQDEINHQHDLSNEEADGNSSVLSADIPTSNHQHNSNTTTAPQHQQQEDEEKQFSITTIDQEAEKTVCHSKHRKIEPIITEPTESPSLKTGFKTVEDHEDFSSPTISSCNLGVQEEFQFTVVEIQTIVNDDVKSPSPVSNCCFFMTKLMNRVDKILVGIIVSTLIISCFFLSFPIPLISVGTYYLQSSKFETSSTSDSNTLIFTRFPCFVTGRIKCNVDGDLYGTNFKVVFPSFLRDGNNQNNTSQYSPQQSSTTSGKTRTLLSNICYPHSTQFVEDKEYICYTNRDESKVTLSEPSSSNSTYYTNIGFQLLLFGVIGLIASVCIVVSLCCTSWLLIEHKPWKTSYSLTNQDQALKEATAEAQIKEKETSV